MSLSGGAWGDEQTRYFFELTPERVLGAVEASGFLCTGRCVALNSFENRVYDVEIEGGGHRVVKFYRPGRWSLQQILEEHRFLLDLREAEIPVIAPLAFPDGETLREDTETRIRHAIFPRVGGRAPDELSDEALRRVGRLLGRIHNAGAVRDAPNRVRLDGQTYGIANLDYLLSKECIPLELVGRYRAALEGIVDISSPWFNEHATHRVHGDCHLGNLLWNQEGPFFLDFDDMVRGPAVQDVWLLVSGRDGEARRQRGILLDGYEEMRAFDRGSLRLIEALRTLRFVHYSAWIARRWEDPAFPRAFPEFGSHRYWQDETRDLELQLELVKAVADLRAGFD